MGVIEPQVVSPKEPKTPVSNQAWKFFAHIIEIVLEENIMHVRLKIRLQKLLVWQKLLEYATIAKPSYIQQKL